MQIQRYIDNRKINRKIDRKIDKLQIDRQKEFDFENKQILGSNLFKYNQNIFIPKPSPRTI